MAADYAEVTPGRLAKDLINHLSSLEDVVQARCFRWLKGLSSNEMPDLQIVEARAAHCIHYLTAGASRILDRPGYGLEFCFQAPEIQSRHIELMAMVAYMHSDPNHRLSVGDTLNIGRPVVEGSNLDRLLVSVPYPYGEEFEFAHLSDGGHARLLWLLPISAAEERLRHSHGLDHIEQRFDERELDYLNFFRASVTDKDHDNGRNSHKESPF